MLFVIGAICLVMFVRNEQSRDKYKKDTLVDLALFKIREFTKGLNIRFFQVALVAGTTFAVPLYLQVTYGLSAFETGLILIGFTAGILSTSIGASKYGLNYAAKQKVGAGFLVSILGLLILAVYVANGDSAAGMIPGIFVYGLGLGLITSQIVNMIMSTVKSNQTAEASGITSTLDTLGSSVGTAIIGTVLVVSLTFFAGNLVSQSTVFSEEAKTQITSEMSASIDVVSSEVVSETIQENGMYEEEIIRIYDQSRENAFMVTLLFMATISLISFILARRLADVPVAVTA
jgi:hypothetical protein